MMVYGAASAGLVLQVGPILDEVLQETRIVQGEALKARDNMVTARQEVQDAEARIHALETQLQHMSELVREDQLTGSLNRRGLDDVFGSGDSRWVTMGVIAFLTACFVVSAVTGVETSAAEAFERGRVTFPKRTRVAFVHVRVVGDTVEESDEFFKVRIFDAVNAKIADPIGKVTIVDDDEPSPPPAPRSSRS